MVKSLLIGLLAVLVLATGATAAGSKKDQTRYVNRLCVWVEQGGTPDTAWDLKAVKAYTAVRKTCIVGKRGKPGKNGKAGRAVRGAAGAVGPMGPQGLMGTPGAQGLRGIAGLDGKNGVDGLNGENGEDGTNGENGEDGTNGENGEDGTNGENGEDGTNGENGEDGTNGENGEDGQNGVSVTSAVEPAGENCPAGGSVFTAASGVTYACNGAKGDKGEPGKDGTNGTNGTNGQNGQDGADGLDGASIITVAEDTEAGEKTFTVDCPAGHAALSGGYDIQGSVTASYRSSNTGDPSGTTSWTITQTSGNSDSGKAYVYCIPVTPGT